MAYRLKDYLYNDKLTKEQNILMDRLYKLRMSGMAEAFEKQLLEPNTGLEPFEVRFAAIVNQEWDQRERTLKNHFNSRPPTTATHLMYLFFRIFFYT